jgi:hypothetical protein
MKTSDEYSGSDEIYASNSGGQSAAFDASWRLIITA